MELTEQIRQQAVDMAGEAFGDDYHCAEAVVIAGLRALNRDPAPVLPLATAFGGGMGKTFEEACGALSGALLVIGHLHGRTGPAQSWETAAAMGAEVRGAFRGRHLCTRCATLRERFGEQQMPLCRDVVQQTVADLLERVELYADEDCDDE